MINDTTLNGTLGEVWIDAGCGLLGNGCTAITLDILETLFAIFALLVRRSYKTRAGG